MAFLGPWISMAFLGPWISSFIVATWALVHKVWRAYVFPPSARAKAIPKVCDAESDEDAEREKALAVWILDSAASFHAVGHKSLFSPALFRLRTAGTAATYQTREGRVLTVAGVGTVSCNKFHLSDVLYVPELRNRVILVSVQQLAERDYLVMFAGGQCSVMDRSSGKVVGKGRLNDDDALYHLDFLDIQPDTARSCVTVDP